MRTSMGPGVRPGCKGTTSRSSRVLSRSLTLTMQWSQTAATEKGFLTPKRSVDWWKVPELSSTRRLYTHLSLLRSKTLPKYSPQPEPVQAPRCRWRRKGCSRGGDESRAEVMGAAEWRIFSIGMGGRGKCG